MKKIIKDKKENKIKLGIPGRGLKESVEEIFKLSGYNLSIDKKLQTAYLDDPAVECFFARATEISPLIEKGILDAGVTSKTAVAETKSKVKIVAELAGGVRFVSEKTRLILAVPEDSSIKSLKDLNNKKIITRFPKITKEFLRKNNISAVIEFSDASNESKVPVFADALVEFANTGTTLKLFNLRILSVLMEDSIIIAANTESLKNDKKREKIEDIALLLKGARMGLKMAGLMLHASGEKMEDVLKILPSLKKPTITHLRGEHAFNILTVLKKEEVREIVPKLKKIGCTDIVEFPLSKVIL